MSVLAGLARPGFLKATIPTVLAFFLACGKEDEEPAASNPAEASQQAGESSSTGQSSTGGQTATTPTTATETASLSTGCHSSTASNCQFYEKLSQSKLDSVNTQCTTNLSGTVVTSCPAEGLVGTCKNAKKNITVYYYGSGRRAFTAQSAQTACTSDPDGAWSPA
ncbi:MAG: hypothetical protein HYT87_03530 [Nitrospirae bacterium]|nr:hypothetical protein [Nitrospirota bacterium]